jgi:hypothetical protein
MAVRNTVEEGYAFGPVVRLRVRGPALARSHFEREYGPPAPLDGVADVEAEVRFRRSPSTRGLLGVVGGHKTARWRVALSPPHERPLRAVIAVAGGPPSFALSLVQGYYVEPLVAVALARAGFVALPSAAVVGSAGALVIMGRSGSGKSSVSVRALASGRSILGDDQVVIGGDGGCWPYPRRLRLYPDIKHTAPQAWPRLRRSTRLALRLRQALRWSTRGYVAPSLAVSAAELGAPVARGRVPAARVAVVERSAGVRSLTEEERDAGWAAQEAAKVLAEQRARLSAVADARWIAALDDAAEREAEVLRGWLEQLPIAHLRIPRGWDAPTAVRALAELLGTDL